MLILENDVIQKATASSATTTAAGFSVDNLKTDLKHSTWRSTSINQNNLVFSWTVPQEIGGVALAFTNLIKGAEIQVFLYAASGDAVPVFDSGVVEVKSTQPPPAGFDANNLKSFAYGGGCHFLIKTTPGAYEKLAINITNKVGVDSFIEVSRVIAGQLHDFGACVGYNIGSGFEDGSSVARTDAGSVVVDRRPVSRVLDVPVIGLSNSDRIQIQNIVRRNGKHTPVFVSAFPQTSRDALKSDLHIYGYFSEVDLMRIVSYCRSGFSFRIQEI